VLGLAAFSEEQDTEVLTLIQNKISVLDNLLWILQMYPAIMLVWLARKAAEAYDENFWPNFESHIGMNIPPARHQEFVDAFERHARTLMVNYTPPADLGTQHLVGAMLFHAGLPLCHCRAFADACRWVERRTGLPDPESFEAGASLRDEVDSCPQLQNIPVLRRAVRGPAGPLVCAEALGVIFDREGTSINPRLTAALRNAFTNIGAGGPRRSARQPFLRLSEDLCALEIVGPRQDASLLAGYGVVWVVNGNPHRCGSEEEFVFRIGDEARVEIELCGLASGQSCRRVFEFNWATRSIPCMVFDAESRREKRIETPGTISLRSGNYWVLHSTQCILGESESRYDWPDGRCAISQMVLRPGREVVLEGAPQPMQFQAALTPFLEPSGEVVRTDDAQSIHFGWSQLPEVWCPGVGGELSRWVLNIYLDHADSPQEFRLLQGDAQGPFIRFRPEAAQWLESLTPGLHHLRCVVTRGGRRAECEREFWYWAGLTSWEEGRQFHLSAMPANLHWLDCRGFDWNHGALRHKTDGHRQHRLAFEISGQIASFTWSRKGMFLESFERRAGLALRAEEHPIPASFPADVHTARWLRVWHVPAQQAELRVNGQLVQRFAPGQTRAEVSLAHLATLFSQGGSLVLASGGIEIRIASFHRPLVVREATPANTEHERGLRLIFEEPPRWGRVIAMNLLQGLVIQFEPHEFTEWPNGTTSAVVQCDTLFAKTPPAQIEYSQTAAGQFAVSFRVPSTGWPAGIWAIELESRKNESEACEHVQGLGGCRLPLLFNCRRADGSNTFENRVLLLAEMAAKATVELEPESLSADDKAAAAKLLCRLQELLIVPLPKALHAETFWLERLRESLTAVIGKCLDEMKEEDVLPLLTTAARECERNDGTGANERCLFATLPALFALPAADYTGIASHTAPARSLKWISELPPDELLSAVVENRLGFLDATVWAAFGCQNPVVPNQHGGLNFDLLHYWNNVIGTLRPHDSSNEWLGDAALGRSHAAWAFNALASHYEAIQGFPERAAELGAVNNLLHRSEAFRNWLSNQLKDLLPNISHEAWGTPWLTVEHDAALVQNAARFTSLLALAFRASGHILIDVADVLEWLSNHGGNRRVLAWLITLAPELLGYNLMFWELIIRTSPHD
jgi:hypothetical protein